jgi:hypothetical protein
MPYDIEVTVTDTGAQTAVTTVTADITAFDELPTISLGAVTVAENAAVAGTVVANITAADEEGVASLTITSDASNYFTVNGTSVELTAAGATYVNTNGTLPYDIEVTVTDTGAQTAVTTVTADITPFDELPTISLGAVTVAENAAITGTVVATIAASDEEGIASLAITSDANNYFTVNGTNVELTAAGATYVTANGSMPYDIEVTVTDTGAQTAVTTVTADITATDDLPTISLAAVPVAENAAIVGTVVANIAAADEEGIASLAISSDANNYFAVNGTTVELTAAGATYVNTNGSLPYDIEVTVTDTGAQTAVNTVAANITAFDELPTISLGAVTVAENAAVAGTVVANITAADEEGVASLAITSDASNYFAVNGSNVELTAAGATYVNTNGSLPYDIEVTVTDTGAQTAVTTVTADITPFDDLPAISLATVTVAENAAVAGSVVANITAADEEGIASLAITSDAGNYFVVNGTTVELTAAGATFVNTNGSLPYDIEVTVTDTGAQTAVSTVAADITPFDELPTISVSAVTVAENAATAGTVVANITAADAEGIASLTITVGSDPNSYFTLNGSTVELTAAGATYANNNGALPYDIDVTVTDTGAQTAVTMVAADITAFDELPTISLAAVTVEDSAAATGTVVANIAVADEEGIASLAITNDANNYFTVNGSNVELTAAGASFVSANGALPYDIEVTAMDTGAQAAVNAVAADITTQSALQTLWTNAPDGWLQWLEEQQSLDNSSPGEQNFLSDSDDPPMPLPDERVAESTDEAESADREADGWRPRFSGSNRQDQFESSVDGWDSSIYYASTSEFRPTSARSSTETTVSYTKLLEEIEAVIREQGGDLTTELLFALDEMRSQLERAAEKHFSDEMMVADILRVAGTTLSAGFLIWLLRAAPLMASVLATLPAWSRFDPLPVLLKDDEEDEEEAVALSEKDDARDNGADAAERLFDTRGHDDLVREQRT